MQQRHISSEPPFVQCASFLRLANWFSILQPLKNDLQCVIKWTRANFRCLLAFHAAKWFHVETDIILGWFRGELWRFRSNKKDQTKKKHKPRNKYMQNCVIIFIGGTGRWAQPNRPPLAIEFIDLLSKMKIIEVLEFRWCAASPHAVTWKLFDRRRRVNIGNRIPIDGDVDDESRNK